MSNQNYELNYTSIVEPKYGSVRDPAVDDILTQGMYTRHAYSISPSDRIDMTSYDTYSIDPVGCKDADDAFSVYVENGKLYIAIHIADPTEYIDLKSDMWKDIVERTTTKYPSNRAPIHMMPRSVLEQSSLLGTELGNTKNAITVLSEISRDTFQPINTIKLLFTRVFVKPENAFSYADAAARSSEIPAIELGLKISESLKLNRAGKTKGVKLNEVSAAYPIYTNDRVYLYQDSEQERFMKQMIAEFAIFANSFVGEYLKINLNTGIFRTCSASDWLHTVYDTISGEQLLQEIITNGIRAEYMSSINSHDLVGMPEYCHFTSPIRRLSDCVCHYLLKHIYFKNTGIHTDIPFSETELHSLAIRCLNATRTDKKLQYLDIKFRLLQTMANMLYTSDKIDIQYYITGYVGSFLNIIICSINQFRVHMSYTLRVTNYNKPIEPKVKRHVTVTKVNCFKKFDQTTIPDLDNHVLG